ncbi:multicopper oxidase family protein [Conyzicola sp.]|uniref:multicopper oxidase family protein n=1 Tax=Conyzicola sp. TaxID=1969404 RepID=UPI00398970BE
MTSTRSALAVALLGLVLVGCSAGSPTVDTVGKVTFDTPLAIPPLAESTTDATGRHTFALTAQNGTTEFTPGMRTQTSGFDGSYLGPTIVADRGDDVRIELHNALDEPTTVHWHGMHLPAAADGGPHQLVEPGARWSPEWTVDQPAATLWYHPHPHGETANQVGRGLAGMVIVRDEPEAALPLPRDYGVDDVPVIVQDARFVDGRLSSESRDYVGVLGDTLLVNGTVGPQFEVTTDVVRLRLLNASPARVYNFGIDDGRDLALIGTDGGLLERPYATPSVQLSPGERAEVLVRMAAGETARLQSRDVGLGGNGLGGANGAADRFDVLELVASAALNSVGTVPSELVPMERLDDLDATAERRFVLDGLQINQQPMDLTRIDEVVTVDATEVWNVRNNMALPHSFHVHDVQFQVLTIGGDPPPPQLDGWKDTILLHPNTDHRIIMRFTDYTDPTTPYMYHCHLLQHEDQGMMGQFVVVEPGQRAGTIDPGDTHDQH